MPNNSKISPPPSPLLKFGSKAWFISTAFGQYVFVAYVIWTFGRTAIMGDLNSWNDRLSHGYTPGETMGNLAVAAHLAFAVIVMGAGPLQLVPSIRIAWPKFHRLVGRTYLLAVFVAVVSGNYMLFKYDIGSPSLKLGFVIQAILILLFGTFTAVFAIRRDISRHHKWALRFFMVSTVAFTYRVMLVMWVVATGGIGIDMNNGTGWFLDAMSIGQFLPLAFLEIYFRTKERGSKISQRILGVFLIATAIGTLAGTLMLTVGFWFPA